VNLLLKRDLLRTARKLGLLAAMGLAASSLVVSALAEENGVSKTPQMGGSSWSFIRSGPTEAIIKAQALAMQQNLQASGFQFVNLDDFWYSDSGSMVVAGTSFSGAFLNGQFKVVPFS
jgi:hypothetical protein